MRDSLPMTALRASSLLELQPRADQDAIRQAYLDLVRVWHPDRFGDDVRLRERATAKLAELNAAYAMLKQTTPAFQFRHTVAAQVTNQPMRTRRRVRVQVVRRRRRRGADAHRRAADRLHRQPGRGRRHPARAGTGSSAVVQRRGRHVAPRRPVGPCRHLARGLGAAAEEPVQPRSRPRPRAVRAGPRRCRHRRNVRRRGRVARATRQRVTNHQSQNTDRKPSATLRAWPPVSASAGVNRRRHPGPRSGCRRWAARRRSTSRRRPRSALRCGRRAVPPGAA